MLGGGETVSRNDHVVGRVSSLFSLVSTRNDGGR